MIRKILAYKICNIPLIGTALWSFLWLSTMFMWYGGFFVERFHPLMGIVEAQVTTEALGIWYAMGFVFAAIQGIGIAVVLKWRWWPNIIHSALTWAMLGIFFGMTVFSYRLVILPEHSIELFLINTSGIITAWTLAALTMRLLYIKK